MWSRLPQIAVRQTWPLCSSIPFIVIQEGPRSLYGKAPRQIKSYVYHDLDSEVKSTWEVWMGLFYVVSSAEKLVRNHCLGLVAALIRAISSAFPLQAMFQNRAEQSKCAEGFRRATRRPAVA